MADQTTYYDTRPGHEYEADHDHIVPVRTYIIVFLALVVLTVITVWVSRLDLGFLNVPIALGIACIKAFLVLFIFMHVKYSTKLVLAIIIATGAWLMVLLYGVTGDYLVRKGVKGVDYISPESAQMHGQMMGGTDPTTATPATDAHKTPAKH